MLKYKLYYKERDSDEVLIHEFTARGDKEARRKCQDFIQKKPSRVACYLHRVVSLHVEGE